MNELSIVTAEQQRRRTGKGLLLLGIFMVFLLSAAYIARGSTDGCIVTGDGATVCTTPELGVAKVFAWTSMMIMLSLGAFYVVPKSFWLGLMTSQTADEDLVRN